MNGKNVNFDNNNIKKSDFYNKNKKIFHIRDIDVNKILVSKKEQYGKYNSFKYFIGYNDKLNVLIFIKKMDLRKYQKKKRHINVYQ